MNKYAHVMQYLTETVWAILPSKLLAMQDALAFLASGGEYSPAEIAAIVGSAKPSTRRTEMSIGVLPIHGTISHRAGSMAEMSGGISTERISEELQAMLRDSEIDAIVLDMDSPGGSVNGVPELADELRAATKQKPIVAHVNAMAASAAYWLASQADSISITPSGEVGSIGVIAGHQDRSAEFEKRGVKTTLVTAGKYKGEGHPYGPMADETREYLQSQVDEYYAMFTKAVARGRGVKPADVESGFGEGRMVMARDAKRMGMVDHIETMDELLKRLRSERDASNANRKAKAEEPELPVKAEEPSGRSTEYGRARLEVARMRHPSSR